MNSLFDGDTATAGRPARRRCAAGGGHVEGRADRAPDPRALRARRAFRGHRGRQPRRVRATKAEVVAHALAQLEPLPERVVMVGDRSPRRRGRRRTRHRHRGGRLGLRSGRLRRPDRRAPRLRMCRQSTICAGGARCLVQPLHITFICSGNICRSPMAEKMFAHQISERGLTDEVRVDQRGNRRLACGRGCRQPREPRAARTRLPDPNTAPGGSTRTICPPISWWRSAGTTSGCCATSGCAGTSTDAVQSFNHDGPCAGCR